MKRQSPDRLVRIALGMFPTAFRARYGVEIWQCIRDARDDLGNVSFSVTVHFWTSVMTDLARGATTAWCQSISREYALALRRTAGIALVAAAIGNIGYDAMSPKLSMGIFAVLLTSIGAIAGALLILRARTSR